MVDSKISVGESLVGKVNVWRANFRASEIALPKALGEGEHFSFDIEIL